MPPAQSSLNNCMVHVVDDDPAVLDAIRLLLDSVNVTNSGYKDAQQFLAEYAKPDFDRDTGCIVMDIRMPLISGIECQHQLINMDNKLPIIFVTGHGDIPMAVEAMKRGAVEFIQKPFREQELIDAIQRALHQNQGEIEKETRKNQIAERLQCLTEREQQILKMLADGKPNKVIALDLHLSQRTVEIHRANVMEKMQAESLAHLIKMYLLSGAH